MKSLISNYIFSPWDWYPGKNTFLFKSWGRLCTMCNLPPPLQKWLFCSHLEKYLQHIACVVKAWYDSPYLNHFHVSTAMQGGYPRSQKWPIFAFHWNLSDHNTPLPECTNMQNKFFDKGSNYIKVLRLLSLVPRRRGSIQIKIKKTKL